MNHLGVVLLLSLLPVHSDSASASAEDWIGRVAPDVQSTVLQDMTDDLRARLEISERADITVVAHNPLVMSVETLAGRSGPFVISVDRDFIHELSHDELEAAIAHELGHVWIYTHPPYIQTERYANEIAMRVIRRSTFEPVYQKVWARTGIRGNLVEFIGPPGQQ
jgi:hypothetical protein